VKAPRSARLCLEILEDRLVPAANTVLTFTGGLLTGVTSDAQTLTLTLTDTDTVDVKDESLDHGAFLAGPTLTVHEITSANNFGFNEQVTFDLNGNGIGTGFNPNFIVNVDPAAGGATVNIGGPTAAGFGTIFGNVAVTMGTPGPFTFNAVNVGVSADVNLQGSLSINTGPNGPFNFNEANIGPGGGPNGTSISGNVTILNAVAVFISNTPIGGSLKIDSSKQFHTAFIIIGGSPTAMTTIGQNLSITTGNLNDFVSLDNNTFVNGNAAINLGSGGTTGDTFDDAATILGNLNVTAGSGPESIAVGGSAINPAFVGNNLAIAVGNGSDSISLTFLSVLGTTFKVSALNGNNHLTVNNLYAPGAQLRGSFGNGNNSVFFDAATTFLDSLFLSAGFGKNHVFQTGGPYHLRFVTLHHFS